MFNEVFKRFMMAIAFSHVLLGCYLFIHRAFGQLGFVAVLLGCDGYFVKYCHDAYELPSHVAPLERAVEKDKLEGSAVDNCQFSNQTYEQPALRVEALAEEPVEVIESPVMAMANGGGGQRERGHGGVEGELEDRRPKEGGPARSGSGRTRFVGPPLAPGCELQSKGGGGIIRNTQVFNTGPLCNSLLAFKHPGISPKDRFL